MEVKSQKMSYDVMAPPPRVTPPPHKDYSAQKLTKQQTTGIDLFAEQQETTKQAVVSQHNLKGAQGQQKNFSHIDIQKLTMDKPLNRHIACQH